MERFRDTRSVADIPRPGRPSNAAEVDRVADAVVQNDGRVTVRDLSSVLSIPKTTIRRILTSHLHLRP